MQQLVSILLESMPKVYTMD